MDIEVLPYPILESTEITDTICRGSQIELTDFVRDMVDVEGTIIYFYREEADETFVLVGDNEAGNPVTVTPWYDTQYRAIAINEAGCPDTLDFKIYVVQMPQVWVTVNEQPTCDYPGSIIVTIIGGSGNYKYSKDDGETYSLLRNDTIFGLLPGIYTIYILDEASPCEPSMSNPVTLTPNSGLYATAWVLEEVAECSGTNGIIKLWADLGTPPYEYSLDGSDYESISVNSDSIIIPTTFAPGLHTFWVKDNEGCVAVTTATVGVKEGITIEFDTRDANCGEDV